MNVHLYKGYFDEQTRENLVLSLLGELADNSTEKLFCGFMVWFY